MSEGQQRPRKKRFWLIAVLIFVVIVLSVALSYAYLFGPTANDTSTNSFLVKPDESTTQIANDLASAGYIRNPLIFEIAWLRENAQVTIRPGEYELSKSMDAWTIASSLTLRPAISWVTVPVGVRKEQIEDLLTDALGWTDTQRAQWEMATASTSANYIEGVYFPDTYLIPTDEAPGQIAERMRDNFKQQFAPYADEALKKKIPWPTVLIIASLIEREAGSGADMPIIAGIIQNRLKVGMPLAIDATLQYMTGEEGSWWPRPKSASSYPDSPWNTYKRTGLPPHPISEPGLVAIEAALNPTKTDCLFYIHDNHGVMHCSKTYSGQLANVNKYLK